MKWINVEDRLPKNNTDVLACFEGWDDMIFQRVLSCDKGEWTDQDGMDFSNEVTHWMELPKDPKK